MVGDVFWWVVDVDLEQQSAGWWYKNWVTSAICKVLTRGLRLVTP